MTTTPAQPAQGPYHVMSMPGIECVCSANGPLVAQMFATPRQLQLDSGADWDANAESYFAYRKRIQPELARELEIRAATARLLAASWEMRGAIQEHLRLFDLMAAGNRVDHGELAEVRDKMRAAIAKATAS